MSEFTLLNIIKVNNILGECILWDDSSQSVWWTDIHSAVLYRYSFNENTIEKFALPERLCSFGFTENDERLICAFASGFAFYTPRSATLEWLYRPEEKFSNTRFNDGRVDRQGRFWSGTMVEGEQATDESGKNVKGSLYWIASKEGGKEHGKVLSDIQIPNSLCWSSDSQTAYFADSPSKQICAYDFDTESATFSNKRIFVTSEGPADPDGSVIDAEGYLWNAQWGGSQVVRYSPQGEINAVLELPVTQPTCVCFGGPNLDILFVSTARENLSKEQLEEQPEAGNVFVYKSYINGMTESRFKI